MKKYNVRSADVLNSADAFMSRLNWSLFVEEQDRLLFGYNEDVEWLPGSPIYSDPRSRPGYNRAVCLFIGFDGNYVRPLYELFDDIRQFYEKHGAPRCKSCEVDWTGDTPCWVCGEERRPWNYNNLDPLNYRPLSPQVFDDDTISVTRLRHWRNTATSLDLLARSLRVGSDHDSEIENLYDGLFRTMREYIHQDVEDAITRLFTADEMTVTGRRRVDIDRVAISIPRNHRRSALMQFLLDETAGALEIPQELITPPVEETDRDRVLEVLINASLPIPMPDIPKPRDFSVLSFNNNGPDEDRRRR